MSMVPLGRVNVATANVPAVTEKLPTMLTVVEAAPLIVPVLDPVWIRNSPVETVTVPALVNGTLRNSCPVPVLRVKVPEALLAKAPALPKSAIELSGWAVKAALFWMLPPLENWIWPATQVTVPLLVSVRWRATPDALIVSVPPAAIVVVPLPAIVPPVQL